MQDGLTLGPGKIMLKALKPTFCGSHIHTLALTHTKVTKNFIVIWRVLPNGTRYLILLVDDGWPVVANLKTFSFGKNDKQCLANRM